MSQVAKWEVKNKACFSCSSLHMSAPLLPLFILILFMGLQGKVGQLPRQVLLGNCGGCQMGPVAMSYKALLCRRPWFRQLYGQTGPWLCWKVIHIASLSHLHSLFGVYTLPFISHCRTVKHNFWDTQKINLSPWAPQLLLSLSGSTPTTFCQTLSCHGSRERRTERRRRTSEHAKNNDSLLEPDVPHLQPY